MKRRDTSKWCVFFGTEKEYSIETLFWDENNYEVCILENNRYVLWK